MTRWLIVLGILIAGCAPPPSTAGSAASSSPAISVGPVPTRVQTEAPPSPRSIPIALPSVAQLSATRDAIWALVAGTRLFRSEDRGQTWQEAALPPRFGHSVAFISGTDGWGLVAAPPATQCQAQQVTLWRTTDGATTWRQLAASGLAAARCKSDLAFADADYGYLVASDVNAAPTVYRSADGGSTWASSAPIADPPGFTTSPGGNGLGPIGLYPFQAIVLLVVARDRQQGQRYVFRSTDGGKSWGYAATVPGAADAFAPITATRWLRLGAAGASFETTDAGASWHAFTTDYRQAAPVAPVMVFADAQTGYATVRGAIQRTVDGGATWTPIRTPGTY